MYNSLGLVKKFLTVAMFSALSTAALAQVADVKKTEESSKIPAITELPNFTASPEQLVSCKRVGGYFRFNHYKRININENFIKKVNTTYLRLVDYEKILFTEDEREAIINNTQDSSSVIKQCSLDYAFTLYHKVLERRYEQYTYFLNYLDRPDIDLEKDEITGIKEYDYSLTAKTHEELEQVWRVLVKSNLINLMLNKKSLEDAKKVLRKRYKNNIKSLMKREAEDAFSMFENAFAMSIDPHTNYLSPQDTSDFDEHMRLSMEGIGATLVSKNDYVEIVSIIPGSPAERSKQLSPKDKIIGVMQKNDPKQEMVDIVGVRIDEAVKLIKGKKGTHVVLEILRGEGNSAKIFRVELVRDTIKIEDSKAKIEVKEVDGKRVGVLIAKSFYMGLAKDMKKELLKYKDEANKLDALIVDLRNNGGGALNEAVDATGLFVYKENVVQIKDSQGSITHLDDNDPFYFKIPLVVLINRRSASSSEIFTGALQDLKRAIVVGDRSFGKGTVQQSRPLDKIYDYFDKSLGSIHYTIAKFYRISGSSNQLKGVIPNIDLYQLNDEVSDTEGEQPNALKWDEITPSVSYRNSPLNDDLHEKGMQKLINFLTQKHVERTKDDEIYQGFLASYKDSIKEFNDRKID